MESPASKSVRERLQRLALIFYAVFLVIVSLLPSDNLPKIPDWSDLFSPDKAAHFGVYAFFAVLLSAELYPRSSTKGILYAILLASAFGALIEILQGISGLGRQADFIDMAANGLGACLGGLLFWAAHKLYKSVFPPGKAQQ